MKDIFLFKKELLSCDSTPRVLLLLSGGKDSVCCLYLLKKIKGIKLEAIFFRHSWMSKIPQEEALRHCNALKIKCHEINYTDDLLKKLADFSSGRPCLTCKPIMYRIAFEFALTHGFSWIATGDNASDKTTMSRLNKTNKLNAEKRVFCSRYLGNDQGVMVPSGISIVRPLIRTTSLEVESFLKSQEITVTQNYSTGDKYFEYSREGCCLQFCDPGYKLTDTICNKLFQYNEIANRWGRKHNVRTSVHIPSTFVVTVPPGFEKNVIAELEKNSLSVDLQRNANVVENKYCSVVVENYPDLHCDSKVFTFLISRFAERLSLSCKEINSPYSCILEMSNLTIQTSLLPRGALIFNLQYMMNDTEIERFVEKMKELCVEIFHSRAVAVLTSNNADSER